MRSRLRRSHLGNRQWVTEPPSYFFIELGLEILKCLLGYVSIHTGTEGSPNLLDREVQNCDACVAFGTNKIDNVTTLLAPGCRFHLLQ
jgi:hypothetical protein